MNFRQESSILTPTELYQPEKQSTPKIWGFPGGPVVDSTLLPQGAQIRSLVRELKSCMLYDAVKKKNKEKNILMCFPFKKKSEGVSTFLFSSSFKFWPPLSWGKDSPPSCPVCQDEWFPTSAFNTVGKSSVTESSQDFSGVSSFYCKNMNIRGLFCGKNHDEENRRRKGKESHSC